MHTVYWSVRKSAIWSEVKMDPRGYGFACKHVDRGQPGAAPVQRHEQGIWLQQLGTRRVALHEAHESGRTRRVERAHDRIHTDIMRRGMVMLSPCSISTS